MKRTLVITMLAIAVSSLALGQTKSSKAKQSSNVEQAIKQLDNERMQAIQKSDTAFIERVYANDYVVIGANGTVRNKAQVIADFKSGALKVESLKDDELKVRVYGDTAILTGRSTSKVKDKGQDISGQSLFTRVYVKRNGQWQFVTHHMSRIPQ